MSRPREVHADVFGYRVFHVRGGRLASISARYQWAAGLNEAMCSRARHTAPAENCACGFWIYRTELACRLQFADDLRLPPSTPRRGYGDFGDGDHRVPFTVMGRVKLSGRTIVGADGWRTSHAEIVALLSETPEHFESVSRTYGVPFEAPSPVSRGTVIGLNLGAGAIALETFDPSGENEDGSFLVEPGSRAHAALMLQHPDGLPFMEFSSTRGDDGTRWITDLQELTDEVGPP